MKIIGPVEPAAWTWPHFAQAELQSHDSGALVMETTFLDRLERLRLRYGRPMIVTSGYRTPAHNAAVSASGRTGPHTTGRAVDIRVYGVHALELLRLALDEGFTGFGLAQKGPAEKRFVHLDDLPGDASTPRPWTWTY